MRSISSFCRHRQKFASRRYRQEVLLILLGRIAHVGHSFANRTDLKKKLFTFLKVLNFFLCHLFINLINMHIGIFERNFFFFRDILI